jgi:hypothetical protein
VSELDRQALAEEITLKAAASGLLVAPGGRKRDLLIAHAARSLGGEKPSARMAAASAGIPVGTCAAWQSRDAELRGALAWWSGMAGLTPEQIRAKAEGTAPPELPDFLAFREQHFAYVDGRTGKWVRARNSWFQQSFMSQLDTLRRGILVLPPGHVKTTLTLEYVTRSIFRDRDFRGLVVQRNTNEASKAISFVQERLTCEYYHHAAERLVEQGNEPITCPVCIYAADLPFKPDQRDRGARWGQQSFRVLGREGGHKDDTLQAVGTGSQIMGIRSDLIVLDDAQSPELAMHSPADSEQLFDWFQTVILSRVFDYQRVIVLANFVSPDDFAHRVVNEYGDRWAVITYPAIRACEHIECRGDYETCDHKDERILVPEIWTWDALMEKKDEVGERSWFYVWSLDEGSFESRTFTREALEAARSDDYRLGEVPAPVTDVFLGVDPAVAGSGVCAIVAWGLDRRTKQRFLVDIFAETGLRTFSNVTDEIVRIGHRLGTSHSSLRSVVIEWNNVQGALVDDQRLRRELSSLGAKVIPYKTATGTGARAEHLGYDITHLGGLFESGLITLPYGGTIRERDEVDKLIDEFLSWRVDDQGRSIKHLKRDRIMGVLFAESEAFRLVNKPLTPKRSRSYVPPYVARHYQEREGARQEARLRRRILSDGRKRLISDWGELPGDPPPGPSEAAG